MRGNEEEDVSRHRTTLRKKETKKIERGNTRQNSVEEAAGRYNIDYGMNE